MSHYCLDDVSINSVEDLEIYAVLWTMIRDFFRKISRGPLLLIQVLQGETCNSAAMKKTLLDSMSGRQISQGLKFTLKSTSVVP